MSRIDRCINFKLGDNYRCKVVVGLLVVFPRWYYQHEKNTWGCRL